MVDEHKKTQYWDHFTDESHKGYRPKKITDLRLKQIKRLVLDDDFLWQEILSRPAAFDQTPSELEQTSPAGYLHARVNFWAMIREKIQFQSARPTE